MGFQTKRFFKRTSTKIEKLFLSAIENCLHSEKTEQTMTVGGKNLFFKLTGKTWDEMITFQDSVQRRQAVQDRRDDFERLLLDLPDTNWDKAGTAAHDRVTALKSSPSDTKGTCLTS